MATQLEAQRLATVEKAYQADGYDALVVSDGRDIKYLTSFSGDDGVAALLLTPSKSYLVTDRRYITQAKAETEGYEVVDWTEGVRGVLPETGHLIHESGVRRVGYNGDTMTHADYLSLAGQCPDVEFVEATPYIKKLRAVKTPDELDLIRTACRMSMLSFYALLDFIKPGKTEKEVAAELEHQFHLHGGDGWCFETIVASGPDNGACPHATVSDRKLEAGDFVTIDFGTYYHGLCSDITRTVVLGRAKEPELYHVFDVVAAAKQAGMEALRPGLTGHELHDVINGVITGAGYKTPHGFGHSFGLFIHEDPFISPRNEEHYQAGTVTTIEPGIYLPGVGGVRQEDDFLFTEDGYERLTFITDHLITL